MPMLPFQPDKSGVLLYLPPILADNLDRVVQDFYDALDGFPDPVFRWIDERLPHESSGPGTWSVDFENDQETAFQFTVANLPASVQNRLFNELENAITEDYRRVSFDHAWFKRTYYIVVRFAPESDDVVTHITYHVYWEVVK